MIYMILYIFKIIFLILIPLAFIFIIFAINKALIKFGGRKSLTNIVSIIFVFSPIGWYFYGYQQFNEACMNLNNIEIFSSIPSQNGFLLRTQENSLKPSYFRTHNIREVGFEYMEYELSRPLRDRKTNELNYYGLYDYLTNKNERTQESRSDYVLEISLHPFKNGMFPIYELSYSIIKISDDTLIAQARELLFGKGVLSMYIGHIFYLSNNKAYLGCGYVSKKPGRWSPYALGRDHPRNKMYEKIDQMFLTSVFKNENR